MARRGRACSSPPWSRRGAAAASPGVPATCSTRRRRPAATPASFPAADEDYFHDMDGGAAAHAARRSRAATCGSSGPAATTASGTRSSVSSLGAFDLLKIVSSHPKLGVQPRQPLEVPRPGQRAVLHRSRPGPTRTATGCGSTCATPNCPPDPFENEAKYPGVADRRARQDACRSAPTTASRPASSACGCFPTRTSTRRRARRWDAERYYNDPSYYNSKRPGAAVPRRHVVRLLPRRPEPDEAAGRSREPEVGNLSARPSARSTSGSTASSTGRATPIRTSFFYQLLHTSRPGSLDTSLVSTDNINNPRTMNAVYLLGAAADAREALGQGERWPAASSTTSSSTTSCRPGIRSRSSSRSRTRSARRACSRTAPTRSARSARSIASTSTSACSARSGCCTSTAVIGGKPITPIPIADGARRTRPTGSHRGSRRSNMAASSCKAPTRIA